MISQRSLLLRQLLKKAPSQLRAFSPYGLGYLFVNLTRSVTYYQTIDHQRLASLNPAFDHTSRKMAFYFLHPGHEKEEESRDVGFQLQLITFLQMIDGFTRQFNFKMIFSPFSNKQIEGASRHTLSGGGAGLLFPSHFCNVLAPMCAWAYG